MVTRVAAGWRSLCSRYIRDLIFGANDGIITTFAVVAGVAGAQLSPVVVIVLGFANLVADGISMGASNFLGTRSEQALCEEAGEWRPAFFGALATFFAFVVAGIIPLVAYLLPIPAGQAFHVAIVLTGVALFTVGALRALIIPRSWWLEGVEMFCVGAFAAAAAYGVGWGLRALIGGGMA